MKERWHDTRLQAVRLVAEILAVQEDLDMPALCETMDLEMSELIELTDRIQSEWEVIKERIADTDIVMDVDIDIQSDDPHYEDFDGDDWEEDCRDVDHWHE